MNAAAPSCYQCKGDLKAKRLKRGLPAEYRLLEPAGKKDFKGEMLDTFEGHLRTDNKVLLRRGNTLSLLDLRTGAVVEQIVPHPWKFAEELKGGEVGFRLQERTSLRAFLPVGTIQAEQRQLAVIDELEKTVVRAKISILINGSRKATWVATEPLRGYSNETVMLEEALAACGCDSVRNPGDYYPEIGIGLPLYRSKPEIPLDSDMSIHQSAGRILRTFLGVARMNEAGILEDQDTEFIHDYRVSLRRMRSLLNLFKGVYNEAESRRMKSALAGIMKQTNRLRDLDVYLMDRENYCRLVPDTMHAGLEILFNLFARERQAAYGQVCSLLLSAAYRDTVSALEQQLAEEEDQAKGPAADEKTLHFARKRILKRYRKVAEVAGSIHPETPDATVHELRIQCKKLRYLIEFFIPIFPMESVKPLVKRLKGLQDVLGRFNDYSVQRESLAVFVAQHPMRGKKGMTLAECVGALVATLYQLQLKERAQVEAGIRAFIDPDTRRAFTQLFSNKDRA